MKPSSPLLLIVDDNEDLALALALRLRADSYRVALASDGKAARAIALAETPLAIILDLHLSDEDGLVLLREFQSIPQLAHVPVLLMTADISPRKQIEAIDAGAWAFLDKTSDYRKLRDLIHELEARSPKPAAASAVAAQKSRSAS